MLTLFIRPKRNQSFMSYQWFALFVITAFFMTAVLPRFIKIIPSVQASLPPVSLTALGAPYTQNFDTLVNTGTSSLTPSGWDFIEASTNANTTYTANNGASNAGETYSYGATGATERAFGGLQSGGLVPTIGAGFTNNTGSAITSLTISYAGEQWRLGTTGRAIPDRIDFQYSLDATALNNGTWIDANQLDFSTPNPNGAVGALDGNAAVNRTAISFTIPSLNIPNGATFFIRWSSFDATGADDGLSVDDFSLTPNGDGGGGQPSLSINDATVAEGNTGTVNATFTVSLSSPAGPGGVNFSIATADGTATALSDYNAFVLGDQIPEGQSSKQYNVTVNGDTTVEPNENFFVNITSVTGATVADAQGVGTITNDDFTTVPINQIQGNGNTSPFANQVVTTTGIVTGLRGNGFFIQTPDAQADANPATSEGIFVFTSTAPPPAAAIGNSVAVTATVSEFIPSGEPNDPRIALTELTFVTNITQLSTGNSLPTPITLTVSDTVPGGNLDQLEKYEGMRVRANSLTAIAPTQGNINETQATATTNGVFYAVITGVARPFREPGIEVPDTIPAPTPNPNNIPRFDGNSERIRVDSDAQPGAIALNVTAGATITNLVGPLDYSFRTYTILPDAATPPVISNNATATPVPQATGRELTVASFNMQRFFDDVNDPNIGEPVLTTTAYNNRLNKASLAIRNVLRTPDVIGVVEMESLTVLQAVATKVNNDAVAASQPNPGYQAFLVEGNDVGGIDVGFLVKTPRISVVDVTQFGKTDTYINPINSQPETLNDRPPLVLRATVPHPNTGAALPFTVIVNHLRSLSDVDDPTEGVRVRAKRKAQAEYLANLIQARQVANPNERIVAVGDFNAFQFNDGFVDSIGTIKGTPAPVDQVLSASSDLVNPNLVDLIDLLPQEQRYSFTFDGNAQALDHILVNQAMLRFLSRHHYARNNGDFPLVYYGDATRPERISDHDMPVAYFKLAGRNTSSDFDGDGKTDISVFRPSNGFWYALSSTNGDFSSRQWGLANDRLAPADYDGDGITDFAVWRPGAQAFFYIVNSSDGTFRFEPFGQTGDEPTVVGDWDGDGRADVAFYREGASAGAQSFFHYIASSNPSSGVTSIPFGIYGDKPVRGDFDGDGKLDATVFRNDGTWHILQSSNNQYLTYHFGLNGDKPVAADYDGDGKTDVAVFRPSNGFWYVLYSGDGSVLYQQFGLATDVLVPADYDIDGKADIAVWRNGIWYILQSYNNSFQAIQFGQPGDIPVPSAYYLQ